MKMVNVLIELSQYTTREKYEMVIALSNPYTSSKSTSPCFPLFVTCSELTLFPDQIL
jgi:hypothetical protein